MITRHNIFEHVFRNISHRGCLVDKQLDALKESGFFFLDAYFLEGMLMDLEGDRCICVNICNTLNCDSLRVADWSSKHSVAIVNHSLFLHDVLVHVYLLQKGWASKSR